MKRTVRSMALAVSAMLSITTAQAADYTAFLKCTASGADLGAFVGTGANPVIYRISYRDARSDLGLVWSTWHPQEAKWKNVCAEAYYTCKVAIERDLFRHDSTSRKTGELDETFAISRVTGQFILKIAVYGKSPIQYSGTCVAGIDPTAEGG